MFWHKKTTINLSLIVFGLIALGIVLSTAVLLFIVSQRLSQAPPASNLSGSGKFGLEVVSAGEVRQNYLNGLKVLRMDLQKETDPKKMIDIFEKTFFTLRVPVEGREGHLAVWLAWLKIKPETADLSALDLRLKLLNLLLPIIPEVYE